MVNKVSAQLYLPNEYRIPVPCNHTEMVKFLAPLDRTYSSVASHLKTEVDHIRNERSMYLNERNAMRKSECYESDEIPIDEKQKIVDNARM